MTGLRDYRRAGAGVSSTCRALLGRAWLVAFLRTLPAGQSGEPYSLSGSALRHLLHKENFRRLERAQQLAEEKGVSLPKPALAYVVSQPLDIYALVGCQSAAEFRATLAASAVALKEVERALLEGGAGAPPALARAD